MSIISMVYTLLVKLSTSKATGMDKNSAKVLQVAAPAIALSLTEIFNMSIDLDQLPSEWKAARVIPLFKKGQRSLLDNYRPISILPVVSKLMERILYDQMFEYLNRENIIFCLDFLNCKGDIAHDWRHKFTVGIIDQRVIKY